MNSEGPPDITDVRGGLLAVQTDELKHLGAELGDVVWRLTRWTGVEAVRMVDPELVASASLSPATYVEAERALFAATGHLGAAVVEWGALAGLVEAVGQWFGGGEDAVRRLLDDQLGTFIGTQLRLAAGPVLLGTATVAAGGAVWWATRSSAERAALGREAERFLTSHPWLVRDVAATLDGVIEGATRWRTPPGDRTAAGIAALVYLDEGDAHVETDTRRFPDSRRQPTTVAEVVHHLRELTEAADADGVIEIQTWRDARGDTRHIVYLPGTDDLDPLARNAAIRDVEEDLRIASGQHSAYLDGVEEAMRRAGIGPTDPVLLAGHSLGGMAAVKELCEGRSFNVTNVITAGSPTAVEARLPTRSHVLSLESSGDIVPMVEGQRTRISPQQTTVRFTSGEDTIQGNHDLRTYERGAAAVDASHDLAVRAAVEAIRPFLTPGGDVADSTFRLSRTPRPDRG